MAISYEKLAEDHRTKLPAFSCHEPTFAEYLVNHALTDNDRRMNTTVIALVEGEIVGFFSYCSSSISKKELTRKDQKGLPGYPIPAILLTRLAVHRNHTGKGIGSDLLIEFFVKIDELNRINPYSPAARIVFLDLYRPELARFYQPLGFKLTKNGERMYINMQTLAEHLPDSSGPFRP